MKGKKLLAIYSYILFGIILTACAQPVSPIGAPASPEPTPTELKPIRLRLDWIPGAEHSFYYVAKDLGFYQEAGLDVTIDDGSGSSDSAKLLGTGEIQFGVVDAAALISARTQGIPIVSLAVIYQDTPISLSWLPEKTSISSPADLSGLNIGANPRSTHYIGMEAFLETQGLKDKVTIIPIGFVGMELLLAGQVDAQMGFITSDPPLIKKEGFEAGYILVKDYGVHLYGLTIATSEQFLRENPTVVKGFVKASLRGLEYLLNNPENAIDIQRKYVSELDSTELGLERLELTFPLIQTSDTNAHGLGYQSLEKWNSSQEILYTQGAIDSKLSVETIFTNIAFDE
jgi:NitT/TauT family transport system substrate-binding protein